MDIAADIAIAVGVGAAIGRAVDVLYICAASGPALSVLL